MSFLLLSSFLRFFVAVLFVLAAFATLTACWHLVTIIFIIFFIRVGQHLFLQHFLGRCHVQIPHIILVPHFRDHHQLELGHHGVYLLHHGVLLLPVHVREVVICKRRSLEIFNLVDVVFKPVILSTRSLEVLGTKCTFSGCRHKRLLLIIIHSKSNLSFGNPDFHTKSTRCCNISLWCLKIGLLGDRDEDQHWDLDQKVIMDARGIGLGSIVNGVQNLFNHQEQCWHCNFLGLRVGQSKYIIWGFTQIWQCWYCCKLYIPIYL